MNSALVTRGFFQGEKIKPVISASILGIVNTGIAVTPPETEKERMTLLLTYHVAEASLSTFEKFAFWSKFCAHYLPNIVDKFVGLNEDQLSKDAPEDRKSLLIDNAYCEALYASRISPYFYKYLRSNQPAAQNNRYLLQVFTERLSDLIKIWAPSVEGFGKGLNLVAPVALQSLIKKRLEYRVEKLGCMLELSSCLLEGIIHVGLPWDTMISASVQLSLIDAFSSWARDYAHSANRDLKTLGRRAKRNLKLLNKEGKSVEDAILKRKNRMGSCGCAYPGCKSSFKLDKELQKRCGSARRPTSELIGDILVTNTRPFATGRNTDPDLGGFGGFDELLAELSDQHTLVHSGMQHENDFNPRTS